MKCLKCAGVYDAQIYPSVNAAAQPELKEKIKSGELFVSECPHCAHRQLLKYNMLYHDPASRLIICLSDVPFVSDGKEGYVCRMVSDAGSLVEKIRIFDSGLDDIVIEMCKFVTCSEMGKEVDLRFFRLEGADNEMVFTYPGKSEMEMIAVGFNVYEDCAGIVRRNPALKEAASGLVKVDSQWIRKFIG